MITLRKSALIAVCVLSLGAVAACSGSGSATTSEPQWKTWDLGKGPR